jgi:predicted unusual protein kinase regulating ubiquinone biosynthesis (AarF/ABC1/UbiB family)
MEYFPGIKINNVAGIEAAGMDRNLLSKRLAESYMIQLCRHGFFHCDPHPGNVACDDYDGGRLIYYDFGMMDSLPKTFRSSFASLIIAMYANDVEGALEACEKLGVVNLRKDADDIRKILKVFLEEFSSTVYSMDRLWLNNISDSEYEVAMKKRRLKLGADLLFKLQTEGLFTLPPSFTFICRSFSCLDGVGKTLDKNYDLFRLAQPFVVEIVQRERALSSNEIKFWSSNFGRIVANVLSYILPRKSYTRSLPFAGDMDPIDEKRSAKSLNDQKLDLKVSMILLQQQLHFYFLGAMIIAQPMIVTVFASMPFIMQQLTRTGGLVYILGNLAQGMLRMFTLRRRIAIARD